MDIVQYVHQTRQMTQSKMARVLGCSRYRFMRLDAGEGDLYVSEWLNLLKWLEKEPIISEEGFFLGDESQYLSESALSLGLLYTPLSTIFLGLLGSSLRDHLPEVAQELEISRFYLMNLANPLPGILVLRLLQKAVSGSHEDSYLEFKKRGGELFIELSIKYNFLDAKVLKFGSERQKGQHFCQQWSLTRSVDCQFNVSDAGQIDLQVNFCNALFYHIFVLDQVLSHLSRRYLKDIIERIVGVELELLEGSSAKDHSLHFQGWCRR